MLCWLAAKVTASPTTVLNPGDIQIVAYASDNPDAFAFVTWVEILEGTDVYFTDKGWDCNGFVSGESVIRYTATETLSPGSVRSYQNGNSNPGWTIVSGSVIISIYGDQLIVYQGSLEDPRLIYAFDNTGGWESCDQVASKKSRHSALPQGLVDGESAVSFAHADNFWYRPWYATSGTLTTLVEWMVNRDRFVATSTNSRRAEEYQVPESFSIFEGVVGLSTYTEYIQGTAPCLLLTGHDGDIFPDSISDRKNGCYDADTDTCNWEKTCESLDESLDVTNCRAVVLNDENTQDMARRVNDMIRFKFGDNSYCHLVVNRLGRIKLDPNREEDQAAQSDPLALQAYQEFHAFASQARQAITDSFGRGLLIDFHGHVHPEARIELGYKIWSSKLRKMDPELDTYTDDSSIRNLVVATNTSLSEVLRGPRSMGTLFENSTGYSSVPSLNDRYPMEGQSYFSGGYNIEFHGSRDGGSIDAVQIEFPRHLRVDNWGMQTNLLTNFSEFVLPQFLENYYGFSF